MAKAKKKSSVPAKKVVPAAAAKRSGVKTVTEVRNTAIPKLAPARKTSALVEITQDAIARRAYEIYASGNGGSETDNWFRAERELRGGI